MRYRIEHESAKRIRIRMYEGKLTPSQEEVLEYALSAMKGVTGATVYAHTCGASIDYNGEAAARERILNRLDSFRFENVALLAREMDENPRIDEEEVRQRKLSPELKRKLRTKIAIEAVADVFLPMPIQLGYHVYQFISLRDI